MTPTEIFWIDANRFDVCRHKTRSLSVMRGLLSQGLPITYLTSCAREAAPFAGFRYLRPRLKAPGLFRLGFFLACLGFLRSRMLRGRRLVLIVFPQTCAIALAAKALGRLRGCRVDIHLDFRTVPVLVRGNGPAAWLRLAIEKALFWRLTIALNRFFSTSNSFITQRMRQAVGCPRRPWCIWTSGVGEELIARPSEDTAPNPPAPFELLYVGSVSRHRGVSEIVRAIVAASDDLKRFVFRVLGGGAELESLKRMVRQKGAEDRIRFEGEAPHDAVPAFMARAHAFISPLPDHPWWRVSSPIKLFEYLATGKPVILTDTAPHRDVVPKDTPGVIWLADLEPPTVLATIRDLIADYPRHCLNPDARLRIARAHTWQNQAAVFGAFLSSLYMSGGPAQP